MEPIELHGDFKEFLRLLNSEQVEYLLVGGYAVGYHGYPRPTGDMDVWVAVNAQNADRLVKAMRRFGFSSALTAQVFLETGKVLRMGIPPVRLEILTSISGVEFSEAYPRRIRGVIDGVEANIVNLSDLKANKLASGRHKDLSDLENLP